MLRSLKENENEGKLKRTTKAWKKINIFGNRLANYWKNNANMLA